MMEVVRFVRIFPLTLNGALNTVHFVSSRSVENSILAVFFILSISLPLMNLRIYMWFFIFGLTLCTKLQTLTISICLAYEYIRYFNLNAFNGCIVDISQILMHCVYCSCHQESE